MKYILFFVKQIVEYLISLVLIILTAPVFAITAILIKLSSPGPVIFRQTRVGKDQKSFTLYKFRSMHTGSSPEIHRKYIEKLLSGKDENNAQAQGIFKLVYDPRVTLIGRFIRKTSIDELPQLFNVLKGNMNLIGPRPAIPYELQYYDKHMFKRFSVKPGLTGLWQTSGRSTTSYRRMVKLDIFYIDNWSFIMDIRILFKTVIVVFGKRWAH